MRHLTIILVCLSSLSQAQFVTNTGIVITNSAKLVTNGDWQNSGTIRNDGTIITSESWQNSGTMDANSTGGFILQFATSKSFSAGSNSAILRFLQKEGAGDASITGKVRVLDSLKILSGLIKMNTASDTLGITPGTVLLVSNGSYVDGPMANFGTGTFLFPVGRSGNNLSIKFYSSNSARVGVAVADAPAGYVAGDAIQSLAGFPFVWNTVTALPTNTAAYIEVQIPDALVSGIANPVAVRKVNLINEFEGMGSRLVSSDGTNTTVRSYSSGLLGMFSVANGFSGTMLGDSTELVALYGAAGGSGWFDDSNWVSAGSTVGTWFGVTEKGGRVTRVNMPGNNVNGVVPASIVNMNALRVLDISNNDVKTIPNFSGMPALTTLDVSGNELDFGSLESNAGLIGVNYVNQDPLTTASINAIWVSSDTTMTIPVGGSSNVYRWRFKKRNTTDTLDIGTNSDTYLLTSIDRNEMGDYLLEVTNPTVPGLTLKSSAHTVLAKANISGALLVGAATPATAGVMQLMLVTNTGSYDTTATEQIGSQGTYLFNDIILDDYLVNGFADTIVHPKAIPTYFENTIYWEEADTLKVEANVLGLDILSEFKPDPQNGIGQIVGTFYGVEEPDGRVEARARVGGAAVSVRRGQGSGGKGKDTFADLYAYTFTDENGEFNLDQLEDGQYKLNVQLPGYPMDTTSDIILTVGNTLFDRQVGVTAVVNDGKIEVEKLVITGWQETNHSFSAYPNPTVDYLFVKGSGDSKNIIFQLHDISGNSIHVPTEWNQSEQRWELNIKGLERGAYILQVHKNKKTESAQILVK